MAKANGAVIDGPPITQGNTTEPRNESSNDSRIAVENPVDAGNDVINGYETIDPGTLTGTDTNSGTTGNTDSGTRKRRGRPPGSRNGAATPKVSKNLDGLESLLFSIHMMGAAILKTPELCISDTESKKLADAIAKVNQFYSFGVTDKTMAWIQLSMVSASIYGPRIVAILNKPKNLKPAPAVVTSVRTDTPKPNGKTTTEGLHMTNPSQIFGDALGEAEALD